MRKNIQPNGKMMWIEINKELLVQKTVSDNFWKERLINQVTFKSKDLVGAQVAKAIINAIKAECEKYKDLKA